MIIKSKTSLKIGEVYEDSEGLQVQITSVKTRRNWLMRITYVCTGVPVGVRRLCD